MDFYDVFMSETDDIEVRRLGPHDREIARATLELMAQILCEQRSRLSDAYLDALLSRTRPQIYIDFWGTWTPDPLGERSYLINFVRSINGSTWLETLGQYGVGWQHVTYNGSWSDSDLSHRPGPNSSKSATEAEVRRAE